MQSQSQWYLNTQTNQCQDAAEQAFQKAVSVFRLNPLKKAKLNRLEQLQSLGELEAVLNEARVKYEGRHESNKTKKWLSKLSSRICFYGQVMDVMIQHHPEYVSLAWGAMKFLFISVENHEKQVKTLAKGLTHIADVLPRIELANMLYPTARMQNAVAGIYTKIIDFFLRAEQWYQQGKLRHAWESLSRPVELYYDDLIREVKEYASDIESLANAGAHAEQRDMHLEIQALNERVKSSEALLREMRGLLISYQAIQTSANLDTNQRLTDLQLNQIMDFLSQANALDPLKVLQFRSFSIARTRHRLGKNSPTKGFWTDAKLHTWESSSTPSVVMVRGGYDNRIEVQSFAIEIIRMLRSQEIPVVWALPSGSGHGAFTASPVDVIKGLVCQAIKLNISLHTERSLAFSCAQFRTADTIDEWLDLLAQVVATFVQLYVVMDVESVGNSYSQGTSWLAQFLAMFARHAGSKWIMRLKILLIGYGPMTVRQPDLQKHHDIVVSARPSQANARPVASRRGIPVAFQKHRHGGMGRDVKEHMSFGRKATRGIVMA